MAFLEEIDRMTQAEAEQVLIDAERYRAFMATARFKWFGSANIDHGNYPHDKPKIVEDIAPGDWVHFGLEVWDRHPAGDDNQAKHGRALLNAYVDYMVERLRSEQS